MPYENNFGGGPPTSNNLWVGNNYSTPYYNTGMNNFRNPNMYQQQQQQMVQPQRVNNVLQVMGPESAQAYQIGPDSNLILMDSNRPVFYTKRSDSSGYSETKAYQFFEIPLTQITNNEQTINQEFVTKAEFEDFKAMMEDLVMKNE